MVQRRARELGAAFISDPASLPGTLVSTVLRIAAAGGDTELYDLYLAQLDGLAAPPEECYRFFSALPSFSDQALVPRTLEFAISSSVRTPDTATLIAGLMARSASGDATWQCVQAEWPTLTQKLGTFQGIPRIIRALGTLMFNGGGRASHRGLPCQRRGIGGNVPSGKLSNVSIIVPR